MECFFPNCCWYPELICDCKSKKTLMCRFHRWNHIDKLPNYKHNIDYLEEKAKQSEDIIDPKSNDKEIFYILKSGFAEFKYNIEATKNAIIAQTEKIKSEISSYSDSLVELLTKIKMKYKKIYKSYESSFRCGYHNLGYKKQLELSKLIYKIDEINRKNILNRILAELDKDKEIDLSMKKFSGVYAPSKAENLYFVKTQNKLISFNPSTNWKAKSSLSISYSLCCSTFCYADGNLFCYGGYDRNKDLGKTFLVTKKGKIKFLKEGIPCKKSSSIYKKGFFYVFGGENNNKPIANARRFNLKSKKWEALADLPRADSSFSLEKIKNTILIVLRRSYRLYIYDLNCNNYSKSSFRLNKPATKLICRYQKKAYIIEAKGKIYESLADNIFEWNILSDSNFEDPCAVDYKSYSNGSVYFLLYKAIYKFDLESKVISKLTSMRINKNYEPFIFYFFILNVYSPWDRSIYSSQTIWISITSTLIPSQNNILNLEIIGSLIQSLLSQLNAPI